MPDLMPCPTRTPTTAFRSAAAAAVAALLVLSPTACDRGAGDRPPDAPESSDPAASTASPDADLAPAPRLALDGLELTDLIVAEPVTGERTALYLSARSEAGDTLVAVEAEGCERASLHRTTLDDGVMRMRPVDPEAGVVVPPGGVVRLRPGGLHGMLEGLTGAWSAGDTVRLTLTFRTAGAVEAPALVVPYAELDARFPEGDGRDGEGHDGR